MPIEKVVLEKYMGGITAQVYTWTTYRKLQCAQQPETIMQVYNRIGATFGTNSIILMHPLHNTSTLLHVPYTIQYTQCDTSGNTHLTICL